MLLQQEPSGPEPIQINYDEETCATLHHKDIEIGEQSHTLKGVDAKNEVDHKTYSDIASEYESGKTYVDKSSLLPSFLDELEDIVNIKGDALFASWYNKNGNLTKEYSFKELWEEAGVIAYYLREEWRVPKGDCVVLCYNFGLHFFASFLGCLRAGITAVLVYPPGHPLTKSLSKLTRVLLDCTPALILTDSDVMLLRSADRMNFKSKSKDMWPSGIEFKLTDKLTKYQSTASSGISRFVKRNINSKGNLLFDDPSIKPNDVAFIQYTSGSTGDPKGVMVTFNALQANVKLMRDGFVRIYNKKNTGELSDLVGFSWLPQYHDLGLICAIIAPFASGWRMHVMSPITFIKKPLLWLELMSRLRVSWSVAPDFAFNLVVRKFLESKKKPQLDLSSIHRMQTAAEPIRRDTYHNFFRTFSKFGLREDWFQAGYGLAEHVVAVCYLDYFTLSSPGKRQGASPTVAVANRNTFDPSLTLKIVSQDEPVEIEDGKVGEIWISSPSVAAGYFGKPELSEEVFHAKLSGDSKRYLRTGDLGFFENDNLFICGRMKDLIISNGANYYPQDIEMAIQNVLPDVRPGCVAAFSRNETDGEGDLEIVFEIRKNSVKNAADICQSARVAVAEALGLQASRITAIPEKSLEKTTSGKVRRRATRESLHLGELHIIHDLDYSTKNRRSIECKTSSTRSSHPTEHDKEIHSMPKADDGALVICDEFNDEYDIHGDASNTVNSIISRGHSGNAEYINCNKDTTSINHPTSKSKSGLDSHVVVVGAGIVGLCFARDIASMGYSVTIVEKTASIGGVWALNDYPGLRLHHPGFNYRCLSLAPSWMKEHAPDQFYRPNRNEIFTYCNELVEHENIEVLYNTECDFDCHKMSGHGGATVSCQIGGKLHKTSFIFVSTGVSTSFSGVPNIPASVTAKRDMLLPKCLHSSELGTRLGEGNLASNRKIVIVGSGKAAIDILQTLQPSESITWCHRGHNFFLDREYFQSQFEEDGKSLDHLLKTYHESGSPHFLCCKGPLTTQKYKWGVGICSRNEVSHADKFRQMIISSIDVTDGNEICIQSKNTSEDLILGAGDCIVFCTGQKNPNQVKPWLGSSFAQTGPFAVAAPNSSLVPLRLAVEKLQNKNKYSSLITDQFSQIMHTYLSYFHDENDSPREHDAKLQGVLQQLTTTAFPNVKYNLSTRNEWMNEWYGKNISVAEAFLSLAGDTGGSGFGTKVAEGDVGDPHDGFIGIVRRVLDVHTFLDEKNITWNEIGLTSVTSAQLRNELSTHFSVDLRVDCFDQYSTPGALRHHLVKSQNKSFSRHSPSLKRTSTSHLSWLQMNVLQIIGAMLLIIMFVLPIVPAYYAGRVVSKNDFYTTFTINGNAIQWFWFPCVVPTWMAGLTVMVIISKWAVVGQYKEKEVVVQSFSYLRWWFVDRAVHMWEFWVGRFFVDTLLLWLFYHLMGAKINISAELKAFIREFDLVDIGSESSIKRAISCRRFGTWEEEGPSLRFRRIKVGSNAVVQGMLSPGAVIGNNASVGQLSVVDEGAEVPPGCDAKGNPAFNGGKVSDSHSRYPWWKHLEAFKLIWLLVELYIFFLAFLASHIIWNSYLPINFRYTSLLTWVFSMVSSSVLMLAFSVILKWLLIGQKKPGPFTPSLRLSFADWATDYHFHLATSPILPFTDNSRLWNLIFKLHGMKVDMFSKFYAGYIFPSGMDLLRLEKAFTSGFTFDTDSQGLYQQLSIVNSNVGYSSHIKSGAVITGTKIPPLSCVEGLVQGDQKPDIPWAKLLHHETLLLALYMVWFVCFVVSLVPAYEISIFFLQRSKYEAFISLPLALIVQTVVWIVAVYILQLITFLRSTERSNPWNSPLYLVYHTVSGHMQLWSFLHIFLGSPIFLHILKFWGAEVEGNMLFIGDWVYDCPYLCFEDKTIIDSSWINGHFGLINEVSLGVCKVGGVVHRNCFYMANASSPPSRVSGPLQAYMSSCEETKEMVQV